MKILKVPLSQTHDEAHGIEHVISPQLEERLRDVLGDPKVCPHGNPFPGREEYTSRWVALTELSAGQRSVLRRIHEFAEDNYDVLKYLTDHDIEPGVTIEVVEVLPFNQLYPFGWQRKPLRLASRWRAFFSSRLKTLDAETGRYF